MEKDFGEVVSELWNIKPNWVADYAVLQWQWISFWTNLPIFSLFSPSCVILFCWSYMMIYWFWNFAFFDAFGCNEIWTNAILKGIISNLFFFFYWYMYVAYGYILSYTCYICRHLHTCRHFIPISETLFLKSNLIRCAKC